MRCFNLQSQHSWVGIQENLRKYKQSNLTLLYSIKYNNKNLFIKPLILDFLKIFKINIEIHFNFKNCLFFHRILKLPLNIKI